MISALVLAAGRSERMGTQKLLLPIADRPVIARIVDELQRCPLQQTLIVIGSDGRAIQQALEGRKVAFIQNPDRTSDMLSSIRCGLRATPPGCTAFLIVLGDQPNITAQLVAQLIKAFTESGRGIIVPKHNGHRGHPVLMAARFRDELLGRHEDTGLRGLLDAHPDEIQAVEVLDAATLADMDTPEDYRRHLSSTAA